MPGIMAQLKTAMYYSDVELWCRLISGETVVDSDPAVSDALRCEISEGGGQVWYCWACKVVHSPNRPCGFDAADPEYSGEQRYTVPTKAELQAWRKEDLAALREELNDEYLERLEDKICRRRRRQ